MSVQRYTVKLTMQSSAVTQWAWRERINRHPSHYNEHGTPDPVTHYEPEQPHARTEATVTLRADVHSSSSAGALYDALAELKTTVPGSDRLIALHDGNTLVEVERQ